MSDRQVSFRLPADLARALERTARANDRTVSGEIRYAIRRYLRQKGLL